MQKKILGLQKLKKMKIESPLEVLSRAASIVQNEEKSPISSTSIDTKVSPGKSHTTEAINKFTILCTKIIISFSA